jgi:hypothetical protein
MGRALATTVLLLAFAAAGAACSKGDPDGPDGPLGPDSTPEGSGDPAWGDANIACESRSDCAASEDCIDSVCQMPRCTDGPYDSAAPLGPQHYFFSDRELVAADAAIEGDSYLVDSYLPDGSTLTYPGEGGSFSMGSSKIVDVTGGNLLGSRPERVAVAVEGQNAVIVQADELISMAIDFPPIRVAAGDVDHDSVDEVIALGADGRFAVCDAVEQACTGYTLEGFTGGDVAAADVDADGHDEPVFFLRSGDQAFLYAFNIDNEQSGEEQMVGLTIDTDYVAIAAGDADGDGKGEIFALEDGGFLGFAKDHVHTWHIDSTGRLGNIEVDADSFDVTVSDLDMDGGEEMLVLHDTSTVEVYQGGPADMSSAYSADLSASAEPVAIAAVDTDGDSPSARRISDEPELVAGQPVPTMVLHFPPYSAEHSDGQASIFVGSGESVSEEFTDSVGLSAGVTLGVSGEFPGVFSADVSTSLRTHVEKSRSQGQTKVVGTRFTINADPELQGEAYSVVVLSSACYNLYRYQLEDPAERVGGDGGEFALVVPVGGQSTVWSSNRYNALARALGTLPEVASGTALGDPGAYPASPVRDDGSPVPAEDMVFPDVPSFLVSDVGQTGWFLSVNDYENNAERMTVGVSVSSSITAAGVKFGGEVGADWTQGHSINVGQEALFGGAVPPIPDDPDTSEDEYDEHRYSFSPYVYTEHYTDSEGQDAAYYVLNFTAGR